MKNSFEKVPFLLVLFFGQAKKTNESFNKEQKINGLQNLQ